MKFLASQWTAVGIGTLSAIAVTPLQAQRVPYVYLTCEQDASCPTKFERDAVDFRHRVLATQKKDGGKLTPAHLAAFRIERAELDKERAATKPRVNVWR